MGREGERVRRREGERVRRREGERVRRREGGEKGKESDFSKSTESCRKIWLPPYCASSLIPSPLTIPH